MCEHHSKRNEMERKKNIQAMSEKQQQPEKKLPKQKA